MYRLALRNLTAHKARLALITCAVAIGVSFVVATFIFSDSLGNSLEGLTQDMVQSIDVEVRPTGEFGTDGAINNALVETIRNTPGVAAVGPLIESESVVPLTASGELVSGYPISAGWIDDPALAAFQIADGTPPGANQFALNAATAANNDMVIGETYRISTPIGVVERELSGTIFLGEGDAFGDSMAFSVYQFDDAQRIFGDAADHVDTVLVRLDSTSTGAQVEAALADLAPAGVEVVNARTVADELAAETNATIGLLRNVLLGFAIVSVFVSTFMIRNTFGIILSQRIRELGLLRAIGADGRQVSRSVLAEAVAIGTIASAAGLALGLGITRLLIATFRSFDIPMPAVTLVVQPRTMLVALAVGLGATVFSSYGPARHARRIAPIAALTGDHEAAERGMLRVAIGSALAVAGALVASLGLFVLSGTTLVLTALGGGIALAFLGVTMLSPALIEPVISVLGAPLKPLAGMSGVLARQNAQRNPRRTANTAAALMIGLSLITTVLVVGQSVKTHLATTLDRTVSADYVIANDFEPISVDIASDIAQLDTLSSVLAVSELDVAVDAGAPSEPLFVEAEVMPVHLLGDLFDIGVVSGDLPTTPGPHAVLSEERAGELGLGVGDALSVSFDGGTSANFEIQALYSDTTLIETGVVINRSTVEAVNPLTTVDWIATRVAPGTEVSAATASLDAVAADWPQVSVMTSTDYRESVEAQIDQLLSIVNVLLALSIVIALIGIGLTLALSVFERTREIGLLRAIGMSGRQVRRMVRWEAALIGLFGAVLGVVTGLAYGWGATTALPDSLTSVVSIPTWRISQLVLASAVAALIAALLPARRAGRLNVLDAITGRRA